MYNPNYIAIEIDSTGEVILGENNSTSLSNIEIPKYDGALSFNFAKQGE